MLYSINSLDFFQGQTKKTVRQIVDSQLDQLNRIMGSHSKIIPLDINFKTNTFHHTIVQYQSRINGTEVDIRKEGELPEVLKEAYRSLLNTVIESERKEQRKVRIAERKYLNQKIVSVLDKLESYQRSYDVEAFKETLSCINPELESYITRRIKLATRLDVVPANKYVPEELLDTILDEIHDKFIFHPEDKTLLATWVIKTVQNHLNYIFRKELKNSDLNELPVSTEENYYAEETSTSGFGEAIEEDLDSICHHISSPMVHRTLYRWDKEDKEIVRRKEVAVSLDSELAKMSNEKWLVYDLYKVEYLSVDEIAYIKNLTDDYVIQIVEEVEENLLKKFNSIVSEFNYRKSKLSVVR